MPQCHPQMPCKPALAPALAEAERATASRFGKLLPAGSRAGSRLSHVLCGFFSDIACGLRYPGLQEQLEVVEAQRDALQRQLQELEPQLDEPGPWFACREAASQSVWALLDRGSKP